MTKGRFVIMSEDAIVACADLVGRAGARDFELGYMHDDVPVEEAGWYAVAKYQGARITADEHRSPTAAAMALAERLLAGATCRCRQPVSLSDAARGCRWRLMGAKWEPGCDVPSINVTGQRGDYAALQRALAQASPPANRAERRRAERKRGRR
jgi:hypothetical protein